MGEQTLEFELLTCINMLNKKKKKKKSNKYLQCELSRRIDVVPLANI